ncbi:MAG: hypothetical protein V3V01_11070 [Acidimicrobiales bacterium]
MQGNRNRSCLFLLIIELPVAAMGHTALASTPYLGHSGEMADQGVICVELYGVTLRLDGPPQLWPALRLHLPGWTAIEPQPCELSYVSNTRLHGGELLGYEVWRDDDRLVHRASEIATVARILAGEIHFEIACRSIDYLFVHAGVVVWEGLAIVLPGRSMSGKSTLVTQLVRQGATYYSDEYAVFDDVGLVHSYERPLSIRADDPTVTTLMWPDELTDRVGGPAVPVGLVAALRFDPAAGWETKELSSGPAALAIVDNTVKARDDAAKTMSIAAIVGGAKAIIGTRGDASEASAKLLKMASQLPLTTAHLLQADNSL